MLTENSDYLFGSVRTFGIIPIISLLFVLIPTISNLSDSIQKNLLILPAALALVFYLSFFYRRTPVIPEHQFILRDTPEEICIDVKSNIVFCLNISSDNPVNVIMASKGADCGQGLFHKGWILDGTFEIKCEKNHSYVLKFSNSESSRSKVKVSAFLKHEYT